MTDERLEEIRARNETYQTMRTKLSSELKNRTTLYQNGTNIEFLLDLVDALQAKFDILLPAAQQTSSLLEAIRMDTPWMVSPGVRELYQAVDQDLTAAIEAVLNG